MMRRNTIYILLYTILYIVFLFRVLRMLVTANVAPNSPILVTLIMEAIGSSATLVLTTTRQRNIPEEFFIVTAAETSNFT
jgi:uncharacterized membrane protein